jgi:putative 4-mercaptohistidine N1-methyltranferase
VVSYHEAKAFANWRTRNSQASYRLLTEAEHYRLRAKTDPGGETPSFERWYGGSANPPSVHVATSNFDLRFGSESPVNDQSEKAQIPFSDVFGNVWQWLEDDFHPLDGFKVHPYYDDFSTPCFDGRHTAMTGGSFISTGDEASYYERFHFRPHFYQHAGFRLVVAQEGSLEKLAGRVKRPDHETSPEQARRALSEQLSLHYGSLDVTLPASLVQMPGGERLARFPEEVAETAISWAKKLHLPTEKAIEVGCSVGGGVFKLAEYFKSVLGIDPNLTFIQTAQALKERGEFAYELLEEGEIMSPAIARVLSAPGRDRSAFRQADASALPAEYANFDTVVLNHVLDRVPSPKGVLSRLSGARGLVKKGGLLVIATAFDWDAQLTPKEVWLGGFSASQKPQWSFPALKTALSEDFEELETFNALEITRQSRRRYLLLDPIVTVWRRK